MADISRWHFQMHFAMNENVQISTEMSLSFVRNGPINHIPALVQTIVRRQAIIWTNDVQFANRSM